MDKIVDNFKFKFPRARCFVEFLLNLYGLAGDTFVNFWTLHMCIQYFKKFQDGPLGGHREMSSIFADQ
jgi:hypothetical protein